MRLLMMSAALGFAAARVYAGDGVSFNAQIRPIFTKHCTSCHGGVKQAGGLSFIYRDQALGECDSGLRPIVPGDVESSYLIDRVSDPDPDTRMPPADHGPPLSEEEIALLKRWIEAGAEWELHWSFVPPRPQPTPAVKNSAWPRAELDRFILSKLESEGLAPAADAPRAAWLRRVSLDLTGLPPSPQDYEDFALDNRADAYERVVDRLLASPRFGERWASMWLDLARYADSVGYEKDPRRNIWPYRDWVIRALNADMPFDEFTVKQLAGDLLPDATLADRLATAFHRNTQTNTEGGTDDEEFRTVAVLDRVSTTWQTWQGSTFRCTQCHDHPYDPFRNDEYYRFVAAFNTSRDADLNGDEPALPIPNDIAAWNEVQELDAQIAAVRDQLFEQELPLVTDEGLWQGLRVASVEGAQSAALKVVPSEQFAADEVLAEGTFPAESDLNYEFPLDGVEHLTAVRITALPKDEQAAVRTPDEGFVVSLLEAKLKLADGSEMPLEFAEALSDEREPLFKPQDSFQKNPEGWGEYTRMNYPRQAAFVLRDVTAIPPGARLKLRLVFGLTDSGGGALYLQRARFAASDEDRFSELAQSADRRKTVQQWHSLQQRRAAVPSTAVPVMGEQEPPFARRTFVFERGNWLDKGAEVTPGTPAVLPPLPDGSQANRLTIARWLMAPENPLTARVMVNRLWQELFGLGLVETAEDFGASGTLPSHPELLDQLALRFQGEHGWSIKRMLREMVLSATYRQDGSPTPEKLAADPRNRLLSRGPRTRLTAEMVRDQSVFLSGRFADKMYGPPVMPPQPEGIWQSAYNNDRWVAAEGEDRYRRAIYVFYKRTSGYPSLLTFDAPSRDICIARRVPTNTPLQALVTLNDPTFIEFAQGFAERMESVGAEVEQQLSMGYETATGAAPQPAQLISLRKLYDDAASTFDANAKSAAKLAATREDYALTIVANALLNLDQVLTK